MLRRLALSLIFGFFLLLPVIHVNASVEDSGGKDLPETYFRGPYDFAVTKLGDAALIKVLEGTPFGYIVSDLITPIFHKTQQIAMPVLTPYKELGEKFVQFLNPQVVRDNSIPYTSENLIYAIFCAVSTNTEKYSGFIREDVPASKPQISENWEDSQGAMQTAYNANALLGLVQKTPKNDKYNWDRPPIKINDADPTKFCDYRESAKPHPPVETDITSLGAFLQEVWVYLRMPITIIISGSEADGDAEYEKSKAKYAVRLTEEKVDAHSMEFAHVGDATAKEVEKSPFPETIQAATSRGWAFNFLPEFMSKKKVVGNAMTTYEYCVKFFDNCSEIESPTNLVNNMKTRMSQAGCAVTPDGIGAALGSGDTAVPLECDKKPLQCPIDVIKEKAQKPSDNKCSIANQSSAKSFMSSDQQAVFGSGLSPLAIKVLETAADTYKVPASVLLATMYHEGAFNHSEWNWSDDKAIEEYSDCNNQDPMPSCQEFAGGEGAVGPFGFIQSWWDQYMEDGKNPYDGKYFQVKVEGMDEVVKALDPSSFNPCNFTDAAFMAAREISEDQSHAYEEVPNSCVSPQFGPINFYTGNLRPESCSAWTGDRVATTRLQYAEGIDEGACVDPAITNDIGRMVKMFEALTP